MPTTHKVTPQGVEITEADVVAFLGAKGIADAECPACKAHTWEVLFSPEEGSVAAIRTQPADYSIPCYLVCCTNCGYLRLHGFMQVSMWKKERGGEGNGT